MRRILLFITGCTMVLHTVSAQTKIVTTGNNLVNTADPYSADVVIGSDLNGGIRQDASIMWWFNSSASRISNTADVFYLSQWNTTVPNIGLSAIVRGIWTTFYKPVSYSLGCHESLTIMIQVADSTTREN